MIYNPQDCRGGVSKLQPMGPVWPATCFCKQNFIEIKSHPFICILPMVGFTLQWQSSVVVRETVCLVKPKIITIWPFRKCLLTPDKDNRRGVSSPSCLQQNSAILTGCVTSLSFEGFFIYQIEITISSSRDE